MNSLAVGIVLLSVTAIADAAATGCPASSSADRAWLNKTLTAECRVAALLAQFHSVDEKIAVLDTGGLKRYGLEDPAGSDGPAGPTHVPGVASLPNGLTLAASFDPELAERYGVAVGTEFRAAGIRQMYGPTLDIARTWHSGRVPEAFGEDPELSSRMATWVVRGVQSQGVAATLKHFAVYAQEQGRTGAMPFGRRPAVNNRVSERTIREIYLPAFRAAVEEGGALGVMCAFPRVNGVYACENPTLLGILKNEWHFRGTVAPDFPDAQRGVVAAVNAGLDTGRFGQPTPVVGQASAPPTEPGAALGAALGMEPIPGGVSLRAAVMSHQVSLERLDDMVRRRLMVRFAAEAVEAKPAESVTSEFGVRVAEAGAVLLKNESGLLPLSGAVKSIAVFGAQAGVSPQVATPGSAYVEPSRATAAIDSIRSRAGSAIHVTYFRGSLGLDALAPIPPELLHAGEGAEGAAELRVEYYANADMKFAGSPLATQVVAGATIKDAAPIQGLPANNAWSARWSGTLTARYTGTHYFTLSGAGSGRLYVDDRLVAHFDRVDFGAVAYAAVKLEQGRAAALRVEFTPGEAAPLPGMRMMGTTLGTLLQVGWAEPDDRIERARAAAKAADVAIVFVADRHGEGADRTELSLPPDQNELVAAVAAANPRTIVVLSTAGPVSMPWQRQVGAILETWYAGTRLPRRPPGCSSAMRLRAEGYLLRFRRARCRGWQLLSGIIRVRPQQTARWTQCTSMRGCWWVIGGSMRRDRCPYILSVMD